MIGIAVGLMTFISLKLSIIGLSALIIAAFLAILSINKPDYLLYLLIILIPFGGYFPIKISRLDLSVIQLLIVIMLIPFFINFKDAFKRIQEFSTLNIAVVLFISSMLASSIVNEFNVEFIIMFTKILSVIFLMYYVAIFIDTKKKLKKTIGFMLFTAIYSSVIAILQSTKMIPALNVLGKIIDRQSLSVAGLNLIRAAGPFKTYGYYGMLLLAVLPFVILSMKYYKEKNKNYKLIGYLIATIIILFGLFVPLSRGIWLSGVISVITTLFFLMYLPQLTQATRKKMFNFVLIIIIIIIVLSPFIASAIGQSIGLREDTIERRADQYIEGIELWKEKPIFGWGPHSFKDISDSKWGIHNTIIRILNSFGLFGFLAFLSILFVIIRRYTRSIVDDKSKFQQNKIFYMSLMLGFIPVFIEAQFIDALLSNVMWVIMGLLISLSILKK